MPQQLTEEEIRQLVQEVMTQTGATSPKDFGKVMGAMMPKSQRQSRWQPS